MDERLRYLQRQAWQYDIPPEAATYIAALERSHQGGGGGTTLVATHVLTQQDGIFHDWLDILADGEYDLRLKGFGNVADHRLVRVDWEGEFDAPYNEAMNEWYGGFEGEDLERAVEYARAFQYAQEVQDEQIDKLDALLSAAKHAGFLFVLLDFSQVPEEFDVVHLANPGSSATWL